MVASKLRLLAQMRALLRAALEISERSGEHLISAHIGQIFGHLSRKIRLHEAALEAHGASFHPDNEIFYSAIDQTSILKDHIGAAISLCEILREAVAAEHLDTALQSISLRPALGCRAND
ncbi:hypothetical protein [Sphingomonas abietis]|uniref:Uncharacterized protein n=1 Tax=Sphingomonas abietis TaxID=3012344 RepID=A0ABY7NNP9_9SPHN|nr:hypothetical protein [Sphingomonas abietis]WBO23154.1 hypothetical protein PBT88_03160 [Sphingomonas abietis]